MKALKSPQITKPPPVWGAAFFVNNDSYCLQLRQVVEYTYTPLHISHEARSHLRGGGMATDTDVANTHRHTALIATLLMTALVSGLIFYLWHLLQTRQQLRLEDAFHNEIAEITTEIETHMGAYAQVFKGGRSFFMSSEYVSREEWHSYVTNLDLNKQYPGIQGVSYASLVAHDAIAAHEQQIRSEGFPDYHIWPTGKRDTYTGIVYLEPFDWRNQRAFGYDMFAEPTRHEAMARARDTGQPALSGKVLLVQETDEAPQAGTLLYVPLYRKGVPLQNVQQRQQALLGWVYSPFRMDNLLQGMLGSRVQGLRLRIYDQTAQRPADSKTLLFDSLATQSPAGDKAPVLTHDSDNLIVAGRPWLLDFDALPEFAQAIGMHALYPEMGGMGLIGLLLIILT